MKAFITWAIAAGFFLLVAPLLGWDIPAYIREDWWNPAAEFLVFVFSWRFLIPIVIPVVLSALFGKSRPTKDTFYKRRDTIVFLGYVATIVWWAIMLLIWKSGNTPEFAMPNISMPEVKIDWSAWAIRLLLLAAIGGLVTLLIKRPLKSSFFLDYRTLDPKGKATNVEPKKHWPSLISIIGLGITVWYFFAIAMLNETMIRDFWWCGILATIFWCLGCFVTVEILTVIIPTYFNAPSTDVNDIKSTGLRFVTCSLFNVKAKADTDDDSGMKGFFKNLFRLPLPFWLPFVDLSIVSVAQNVEFEGSTEMVPTAPTPSDATNVTDGREDSFGSPVQWRFRVVIEKNFDPVKSLLLSPEEKLDTPGVVSRSIADMATARFLSLTVDQIKVWASKSMGADEDNGLGTDWGKFFDTAQKYVLFRTGQKLVSLQHRDINVGDALEAAQVERAVALVRAQTIRTLAVAEGDKEGKAIEAFARWMFNIPADQPVSADLMNRAIEMQNERDRSRNSRLVIGDNKNHPQNPIITVNGEPTRTS